MKNWIVKSFEAREFQLQDGIEYWREKVYRNIVTIISVLGLPCYLIGMYMAFTHEVYSVAIIDTFVYGMLVYLWLADPFKLKIKIYLLLAVPLMVGSTLIIILGPKGAGFNYYIGFVILTSILLGLKGAIWGLIIHTLYSTFIALGLHFNLFNDWLITQYTTMDWITLAINAIAISSVTSLPLSVILKALSDYILRHQILELELSDKITQLNNAKIESEKANELKTKFLANMSHEVRTPLNVIMGFSEIVQADMYRNKVERNHLLETINQNGHYLLNIIENVLDISMIESGQFKYKISQVGVLPLMDELKQVYKITNKDKVSIVFNSSESIDESLIISTDETRLKQVLINLINNAIKYTDEGVIEVDYHLINQQILFQIKDTGIGIDSNDLDHIFDRFVKIEVEDQIKDGTGLGLAISKSIIETLKGTISVESKVGQGSIFTVSLPLETTTASTNEVIEDALINQK